jgi:phenylacetate-CoA ligase
MSTRVLKLYQSLPPFLQDAAASIRGWQLRSWRYSGSTDRLVLEAFAREQWTQDKWSAWQHQCLAHLLIRAATQVPYYRAEWVKRNPTATERTWLNLQNWPVLKKESLRASPKSFLRDHCNPKALWCEHTSGSSGTPLTLWQSRETLQSWYALFEARWRSWYGLSRDDRWAILGGQLVVPNQRNRPPFWVHNRPMRQLYMSSYHLKPENIAAYAEALRAFGAVYIWGYASALFGFASVALESDVKLPKLQAAISNAEPLYKHQRELIQQAFGCPVHDTYGMSEMVCAASECDHGTMHLWPEVGIYEVLKDDSDEPVQPGHTGRLVCTGLLNTDMPLIRYEVGDRVALAEPRLQTN